MLFDSLDKLRRNSIFTAILLIALGVVILICPTEHADTLMQVLGYVLIVITLVTTLSFLSSKKSLMDYVKFGLALVLGIGGLCVLLFRHNLIVVLAVAFGLLLALEGLLDIYHSLTHARLSGRKGWWALIIFGVLQIAAGVVILINPAWQEPHDLMKVIGCAILFAAIVSIVRLFWIWPKRKAEGGENDGE